MKRISQIALGAALALGIALPAPGFAQQEQAAPRPARDFKLSKEERAAMAAFQTAFTAKDYATSATALAAAQAAAQGADARYVVGTFQLQLGLATSNKQQQIAGIEAVIASGQVPAADLPELYLTQAGLANDLRDYNKADAALTRYMALKPNDLDGLINMAQTRVNQKRIPEAITILERAIGLQKASGQPVKVGWYTFAVSKAYEGKVFPQAYNLSRQWLAAYPSPTNWRDSLTLYRENSAPDAATRLDIYRLQRLTKALAGERDYYELTDALSQGGYPGELNAVLEEGVALKMLDPAKAPFSTLRATAARRVKEDRSSLAASEKAANAAATGTPALKTADAYFGYGEYAKAVVLYRTALQKGSVDANVVNTRLGMALAQAGQKAEAEAAFKAVGGPRAELGAFLLVWLSQRA